ncbi:MAG: protein-L-isoaspartate O-methyltransferase [Sphingobium sp.]|jgi:protein-L-isoaspartate(D-aspartate) O-methyltransferase|nr:protein-L-isoaspartate O-methyltransferase [Sphingobium sp.]MCI1272757.1 protein-L-isoaspartate O-methyltransferase [Sphingobium sp.]MCI1757063.1 protein-L-isoaspartate O-methyltransferase [Sphingobium sp.]MCI2054524.1 protein-L-isoaspartate O-methyltransferase [Sphingobium sp.]
MSKVDFAAMRAAMVASQLRTSDVNDPAIIAAMASVPREDFVPAERQDTCYIDRPIPLGGGVMMNPPLATGRLLLAAQVKAGDKVLLLGDSTGYTAALLKAVGAEVTSVQANPARGNAKNAPYDAIVIDGAVDVFPPALTGQLADDGRIATGLVERGVVRLASGRKAAGVVGFVMLADIEMARASGFEPEKAGFVF